MNIWKIILLFFLLLPTALLRVSGQSQGELAKMRGIVADRYTGQGLKAAITYVMMPYWEQTGIIYSNDSTGYYELYLVKNRTYQLEVITEDHFPFPAQFWISKDESRDFLLTPTPQDVFRLEHLLFEQSKANIMPSSYPELDQLVERMTSQPQMVIQLEGHTDIMGNSEANLELSEDRVGEVKKYLVKHNIRTNRLMTKAYGDTRPLTHDRSEEGKRLNRRVEVRIVGGSGN